MVHRLATKNETYDISSAKLQVIIQGTADADQVNSQQTYANDVSLSRIEMRVVPAPPSLPET